MTNQNESENQLKLTPQNLKGREHLIPTIVINLADKVLNSRDPQHIKERYLDQLDAIKEFSDFVTRKYRLENNKK